MKISRLKKQIICLDLEQQSQIKGGTGNTRNSPSIIIEDVDEI